MTNVNLLALRQQADIRSPEALLDYILPKIFDELNDVTRIEVFRLARNGMVAWDSQNGLYNAGDFLALDANTLYQKAIREQDIISNDDKTEFVAPLIGQGDIFALLVITFAENAPTEQELISNIASELSLLLYTVQVETLLRNQIEITGKLAIASTLPEIASIIAKKMTLKGQFVSVNVFEYDENGTLTGSNILATANREKSYSANIPMDINLSALAQLHHLLLTEGELLVSDVADYEQFSEEAKHWLETQKLKSMYVLPMWVDSQLYAFISLNDTESGLALSAIEKDLYHNIVQQAATAIEKQRLLEHTQQSASRSIEQARILRMINELIAQSNREVDEIVVLQEMANILLDATAVDHVGVVMRQGNEALVVGEAPDRGLIGKNIELGTDSMHNLLESRPLPFIAEDVANHPDMPEATRQALLATNIPSIIILPMFDENNTLISTISLDYFSKQETIDPEVVELGQTIVSQVALSLQKKRLLDETQEQASQNQRLARNKSQANEIIRKLQEQLEVSDILKVTVEELGKAIGAKKGRIRIGTVPQNVVSEASHD